jgi:hypothetical protein
MAPKRRREEPIEEDASSPDPLANSAQQDEPLFRTPSLTSPRKALKLNTPSLRPRSPQKTVLLDPISQGDESPWRIRVTVQAEPKDDDNAFPAIKTRQSPIRSPAKRVKTISVPLKDPDSDLQPSRKGRGRPRRSGNATAVRPPTPARTSFGHDYDEEDDRTFHPSRGLQEFGDPMASPKRRRGRARARSTTPSATQIKNEEADQTEEQLVQDTNASRTRGRRSRSISKEPLSQDIANITTRKPRSKITPVPELEPTNEDPIPQRRTPGTEKWSKFSALPPRAPTHVQSREPAKLTEEIESESDEEEEPVQTSDEEDEEEEEAQPNVANRNEDEILQEDDFMTLGSFDEDSNNEENGEGNDVVIGDETMMKSMDMTIVSPRSLYSKLDTDSSRLEASKNANPTSPRSSLGSSPHVKFSSPLVAPTPDNVRRNSRAPSASRDLAPPQRSNLKVTQSSSPSTHINPFKPLPTPDSDDKMSDDEKPSAATGLESIEERQSRWQRERQEVANQARAAQPVTVEEGDEEEESEEEEEEDLWVEAANKSSSSLQQESSYISNRPSIAEFRETKRQTNHQTPITAMDQDLVVDQQPSPEKEKGSSEMSLLFNAFAANRSGQDKAEEQEEQSPDASKEDLSAFLRRKVSNMMDAVDFSFTTPGRKKAQKSNPAIEQKPPTATTTIPVNFGSSVLEDAPAPTIPTYSPKQSSPLKRRISVDGSDSEPSDESSDLSDVRQLQEENRPVKRQALESQRPVYINKAPRKSLLQLAKERQARAATGLSSPKPSQPPSRPAERKPPVSPITIPPNITAAPSNQDPVSSGVFSRIWSYVSNTQPPSPTATPSSPIYARPSHPLLRNFRLLPATHPWTENHFVALLALYKHWQTHTSLYSPSHPQNAALLTPPWRTLIDIEFSNWGYSVQLTPTLIVLAALFSQLLVLPDADAYEALYGERLEMGDVARRTEDDGEITEWHVVLRLFCVSVGDVVRAEEREGRSVDRRPQLKWRYEGQWVWRRGWFGGLL